MMILHFWKLSWILQGVQYEKGIKFPIKKIFHNSNIISHNNSYKKLLTIWFTSFFFFTGFTQKKTKKSMLSVKKMINFQFDVCTFGSIRLTQKKAFMIFVNKRKIPIAHHICHCCHTNNKKNKIKNLHFHIKINFAFSHLNFFFKSMTKSHTL